MKILQKFLQIQWVISATHLSEPNLVELGKTQNKNSYFSEHIKKHLDSMIVSIEMLKKKTHLKLSLIA